MRKLVSTTLVATLLALAGISQNVSAGETAADLFRSVVTAENLDLEHTAEFPANPELQTLEAARREAFFLSLLGVRGSREESRGGWRTARRKSGSDTCAWRSRSRYRSEPSSARAARSAISSPTRRFPGDVNDDAQWVNVPLPAGQAGLRVWTFPPGVVTRALRFSFSDTPAPGTPSRSGFGGALILAERLHNLTPEADAYASSENSGERTRRPNAFRVGNLVNELAETKLDGIGYPYAAGEWTAAPTHDVSREHPQWVVLSWPEAKTFSGVGLLNAFAKEIEIDALNRNAAGHPATAPESAWNKVGAVTWPVWWRPSYTAIQTPFAEPVTTRALRLRIVKTLSDENPDIVGHFDRNPQDRNRHVRLGGVMAFTTLGDKPIPPRPTRGEEPPPLAVRYAMPYDGNKLWGTHRFGGPNGLCYAGFLAHDGGKVYTAGIGWGSYLGINDRQYMVADPRAKAAPCC